MAEAVLSSQISPPAGAQLSGWAQAMTSRHRTMTHRIMAAVASTVVMSPIIGIRAILGWVCIYLLIIAIERVVINPSKVTDPKGPRGLQGLLYDSILFVSAMTFAWIAIPLWFTYSVYGGLCAVLYLAAGMVQSINNGVGSARITIITATPTGLAIVATPWFLDQHGVDNNAIVATTTACIVFLGICLVAGKRLHDSNRQQQRAYALAERKRKEAEAAVADRTTFLSTIAHDLRTPITAILTGVETLKDDSSPKAREQLAMIADAGLMMNSLLNDLLDQARINAGRMNLNTQAFSLSHMLNQTSRLWHDPIRAKGLEFNIDIADDLPLALVGDEMRLRQVLNNLLSNALKFTQEGSVTLRCRSWTDEAGNHALTLDVEDTGPGLAHSQMDLLGTPFEQISNDVASVHGGSGLGLSICRELMRLMNGRLTTRSQEGQGSIFTMSVTLPPADIAQVTTSAEASNQPAPFIPSLATLTPKAVVAEAMTQAPVIAPEPVIEIAPSTAPTGISEAPTFETISPEIFAPDLAEEASSQDAADVMDEAPLRVLVVDDHEINRRAIQLILQPFECDVTMAGDGMTALEIAAQNVFDVIFMDVRMPELDGRETTRRLRKSRGPNAGTPVIAVTADNAPDDQLACAAAGMTAYLAKPLTPAALIATLQTTLEKASRQAAA